MAAFQFYVQSGKQRKVEWVGDDSHVAFGKRFPDEKGSVMWCVVMMQQQEAAPVLEIMGTLVLLYEQQSYSFNRPWRSIGL
jgi:hypothetical protein